MSVRSSGPQKFCQFVILKLFIFVYYLFSWIVYINFSMFSFFYLFAYTNDYFLYICNFFLIFHLQLDTHTHTHIYIYIIFLYIVVKENVLIKSTKFGARWNNFCRLNDLKKKR